MTGFAGPYFNPCNHRLSQNSHLNQPATINQAVYLLAAVFSPNDVSSPCRTRLPAANVLFVGHNAEYQPRQVWCGASVNLWSWRHRIWVFQILPRKHHSKASGKNMSDQILPWKHHNKHTNRIEKMENISPMIVPLAQLHRMGAS